MLLLIITFVLVAIGGIIADPPAVDPTPPMPTPPTAAQLNDAFVQNITDAGIDLCGYTDKLAKESSQSNNWQPSIVDDMAGEFFTDFQQRVFNIINKWKQQLLNTVQPSAKLDVSVVQKRMQAVATIVSDSIAEMVTITKAGLRTSVLKTSLMLNDLQKRLDIEKDEVNSIPVLRLQTAQQLGAEHFGTTVRSGLERIEKAAKAGAAKALQIVQVTA